MAREHIISEARFGKNPTWRLSSFQGSIVSIFVEDANNPANLMMGQADNSINGPTATYFKCRGTVESPADPQDHDHIWGNVGYAYSGGTWFDVGTLFHRIDGAFVSGQRPPARWEWHVSEANTGPVIRMVMKSDGKLGVGRFEPETGLNPAFLLHVAANADSDVCVQRASANTNSPTYRGRKSRGTLAAPATVQDGDEMLYISGEAYTNAWHDNVGAIALQVDGAVTAGQRPANRIVFRTGTSGAGGPTDRMKILAAGTVYIGTSTGTADTDRKLHVLLSAAGLTPVKLENANGGGSANVVIVKGGDNATTGSKLITFQRPDGTEIGSVSQNAAGTVAYNTSSDARLKKDVGESAIGLAELLQIPVRQFRYISDPSNRLMCGFVAQEVHPIFPDAVTVGAETKACDCAMEGAGEHDADCCNANPWGVDYGRLTPLLVRAVQQLAGRVSALEAA